MISLTAIIGWLGCDAPAPPVAAGMVAISGGQYRLGSDSLERQLGYSLSPPNVRRAQWYDAWERTLSLERLGPFWLDSTPVTHAAYARFASATGHPTPYIDEATYAAQGFLVHAYEEVVPFLWHDGQPDPALGDHPVVLVHRDDAAAYCAWRGARLPTEHEWEAACRGVGTRIFPWGNEWRPGVAAVETTFTAPVTAHRAGATPEGVLDMAGNVFEWTSSDFGPGRATLKGCSWDDAPGTCRCAFRHGRPPTSKHLLIGFRCARSREH